MQPGPQPCHLHPATSTLPIRPLAGSGVLCRRSGPEIRLIITQMQQKQRAACGHLVNFCRTAVNICLFSAWTRPWVVFSFHPWLEGVWHSRNIQVHVCRVGDKNSWFLPVPSTLTAAWAPGLNVYTTGTAWGPCPLPVQKVFIRKPKSTADQAWPCAALYQHGWGSFRRYCLWDWIAVCINQCHLCSSKLGQPWSMTLIDYGLSAGWQRAPEGDQVQIFRLAKRQTS